MDAISVDRELLETSYALSHRNKDNINFFWFKKWIFMTRRNF